MPTPPLSLFIQRYNKIMSFDPGETTGFCVMEGPTLLRADHLITKSIDTSYNTIRDEFISARNNGVSEVVIEDYRVYAWKTDEHAFAGLHTPKLIGMLVTFCISTGLPYTLRMAQPAKAFVTDQKLEDWGLYDQGRRHSRDAMRHAIFQLCFPGKDVSKPDT